MNSLLLARRKFLKKLAGASAALALLGGSTPLLAARRKALTGVRVAQAADDHTRVVFDLSGPLEHKLFTLENPPRVVVDLIGARKSTALSSEEKRTKLLKGIRSAVRNDQAAQLPAAAGQPVGIPAGGRHVSDQTESNADQDPA